MSVDEEAQPHHKLEGGKDEVVEVVATTSVVVVATNMANSNTQESDEEDVNEGRGSKAMESVRRVMYARC